ncbi:MAG: carboxypeptidase-like regulatory domain-containing protein [Bacteroidales bacterium]|jgi:hypothetical protein|nr:carboxypeptidase-like regulatory domain-containing protein [Bacteroidales bacterium]
MKTLHRIISTSLLLIAFLCPGIRVNAQDSYFTVSGSVKDKLTRKPLEYVTISVVDNSIGTVSNADGEFTLKIPKTAHAAFVECSHIGYYSFRIPVKGDNIAGVELLLTPYAAALNAVIIRGWDARYLMQEAVKKIPKNYSPSASQLTGFYRETVQKRRSYINISEALIDMYKTAYTENTEQDRVQVLKGRKLLSQKASDTLAVKLLGGPNLSVFVDIVKNPDVLLDRETLPYFSFKMEDMTQINGRDQYVVTFQPQIIRPYPLYFGTFYIDKESLAFTRAEFRLDMTDRNKVSEMLLKKKPIGLRFRPEEATYVVTYQERDGVSYLSYICNGIKFKCDWHRRLFSTNYAVVSEMVVTDVSMQDVTEISRKEAFRPNQILSDKVMDFYDEDFWGAYNIIEPTESLESAVARLKKQQKNRE